MPGRRILWAPWRMRYIRGRRDQGCVFCGALLGQDDRENLILLRGKAAFVILNRFPYNTGHLMVVPNRHSSVPEELSSAESTEIWSLVVGAKTALDGAFQPHGYNVGLNVGHAAGAGIADHLHFHVVPRWVGDTNFMPVLGGTDVISQTLHETYDTLLPRFGAGESP
jgi:ATP adenylyltransferase